MDFWTALRKGAGDTARYAEVAAREALREEGVEALKTGFVDWLCRNKTPGVRVRLERDERLRVDVAVVVHGETYLRGVGLAVQEAVVAALGKALGRPVGQVNVCIADIGLELKKPRRC